MRRLRRTETLTGALQAATAWAGVRRHERARPANAEHTIVGRLRRMVDHAFETVPFYRERFGAVGYTTGALRTLGDLTDLPTTSKRELLDQPAEALISTAIPARRLLPSITSGTSGEVLTVWHDGGRLGELGLAILRVTAMVTPHRPWDRMLYVYTSPFPVRGVFFLYPMTFVPTTAHHQEIAARWRRLKPEVVWIYPSRLGDLIEAGVSLPACRLISVGSELSSPDERASWETHLGSPVRDQYGTEELGLVAAECRYRRRHVMSDLCHVEILGPDGGYVSEGEVGEVVGTNLENLAMPFIRYRQGDRAGLAGGDCECGRTLPVLDPIEGRSRIDLHTPHGERVGSGVVVDALYGLVLDLGLPLAGYRLMDGPQPTLLVAGSLSQAQAGAAVSYLHRRTGLVVTPLIVDRLPDPGSDKRETIVAGASDPHPAKVGNVDRHPTQGVDDENQPQSSPHQTPEE